MRSFLIIICSSFIIILMNCCAKSYRNYEETLNDKGERETSSGAVYAFESNDSQRIINQAKQEIGIGNYHAAAQILKKLAMNDKIEEETHSESLHLLGALYSNVLNRDKDYTVAAKYYRQLIDEHPDSKWVPEAEEGLRKIELIQEEL